MMATQLDDVWMNDDGDGGGRESDCSSLVPAYMVLIPPLGSALPHDTYLFGIVGNLP